MLWLVFLQFAVIIISILGSITMSNLTWILSEWHAISASSSHIKMDGVLFQDLWAIIDVMLKKPEVRVWTERLKSLYEHLVHPNNPHKVTASQLPTSMIEYFYALWRKEGYEGDIDFFITLLFTYLEIIQFEELMATDEDGIPNLEKDDLIPSVLAVAKYIEHHNNQVEPVPHENIMEMVYPGIAYKPVPVWSAYSFIKQPIKAHFDPVTQRWDRIPAFESLGKYPPLRLTIIGASRFNDVNMPVFGIHNETGPESCYVNYNWDEKRIEAKYCDENSVEHVLDYIDMTKYLEDWDGVSDIDIPVALMFDKYQFKLAVYTYLKEYEISVLFTTITDEKTVISPFGPINDKLFFASMDFHNPVHNVVVYATTFNPEELLFLMDQHNLPLPRTS